MTYNRFLEVVEICHKIKPSDVKIRFVKKLAIKDACGIFYISPTGYKTCAIVKSHQYINQSHTLLHEVCHSLTYKKEWYFKSKKRNTFYLCEYMSEKKLRNICREYKLFEVLDCSSNWISKILTINRENENYYLYMANRIWREEGKWKLKE